MLRTWVSTVLRLSRNCVDRPWLEWPSAISASTSRSLSVRVFSGPGSDQRSSRASMVGSRTRSPSVIRRIPSTNTATSDIRSRTGTPRSQVKDAAKLLMSHGFTALPVVDDDLLVGIVTEADLIRDRIPRDTRFRQGELYTSQHHSAQVSVGSVMTSPVKVMGPGADLTDLCQALVNAHIRAMPIEDGSRVVGIVTRGHRPGSSQRGSARRPHRARPAPAGSVHWER
jgi:CBS domain-containing protein